MKKRCRGRILCAIVQKEPVRFIADTVFQEETGNLNLFFRCWTQVLLDPGTDVEESTGNGSLARARAVADHEIPPEKEVLRELELPG